MFPGGHWFTEQGNDPNHDDAIVDQQAQYA